MKIALAQINPVVGATPDNCAKILAVLKKAKGAADLVVFPEMVLSGYPAEDLVYRNSYLAEIETEALNLIKKTKELPPFIIGLPVIRGKKRYNAAFYAAKGEVIAEIHKYELPNESVFDEKRVFSPASSISPIEVNGHKIGLMICEDLWHKKVSQKLKEQGAEVLITINASPFEVGKFNNRMDIAKARNLETGLPIFYVNMIGGQDEIVFDGNSFVMNKKGELVYKLEGFREDFGVVDTDKLANPIKFKDNDQDDTYNAMKLALYDYASKNGFKGVIVGLSGGIDSALTAAIAVDTFGADKVKLFMMPSPYTSKASLDDAMECAKLLNCKLSEIKITPAMKVFDEILYDEFKGLPKDITEENIQARIRGLILMAVANKTGYMLLTTGNKSENAVGYCTLYGDMCGAYNVLKDIYKTDLFELVRWRNKISYVIPQNIIDKPPSAELRDNQKDEDSLPPYETLDKILKFMIEDELGVEEIVTKGYTRDLVLRIWTLLKNSEFKRRQAPPGVKLSKCAFGKERRYPITNGYKQQ